MKNALLSTAALLTLAAAPACADERQSGWYVGASLGVNWLQDTNPKTFTGDALNTGFDTGWALTANVGYRFMGNLRGELELGYRDNNVGSIYEAPNGITPIHHSHVGGDVTEFSVMANALYDVRVVQNWTFSFGGGIGVVESDFDASGSGGQLIRDADDDWQFAWQLIGGIGYSVSTNMDAFVEYRYFADQDHDVITYPNGLPLRDSVDLDSHTVSLGFRYALGR